MTKKLKQTQPLYKVWMRPAVYTIRRQLPGQIRQQIKQKIDHLSKDPRPAKSKVLKLPGHIQLDWEVRRIRLDDWRIIYVINDTWYEVGILTIQKRPPYDYEDLELLLSEL